MRTSFFAGIPAAGIPAKKSKCALPIPASLFGGLADAVESNRRSGRLRLDLQWQLTVDGHVGGQPPREIERLPDAVDASDGLAFVIGGANNPLGMFVAVAAGVGFGACADDLCCGFHDEQEGGH